MMGCAGDERQSDWPRANLGKAAMSIKTETYAGSDDASEGSAAARLLEMTARETDQWRADARSEAEAIVREARAEAERVVGEARVEAYRVRQEVARLEELATEHRDGMRRHLTEMLEQVDAPGRPPESGA